MYLNATDATTHTLSLAPLRAFCNFVFNGKLPENLRPLFFGARLLALRKKDGGIRPIAVGNSIRRLISKVACSMVRHNITPHLSPHQTGFGTKKGAEAAIHATRSFIEENSNNAFLKIDFKNAFNCVRRDVFLRQVRHLCPEIFNFITSGYEKDSILSFNGKTILSQEGAQQGDPIGPMLFCLAIQPIINKITCALNVWYLDDGTIGDSLDNVLTTFEMIVEESKAIGLEVNTGKCELYVGENCPMQAISRSEIKILKTDELYLLGSSLNLETTKLLLLNKSRDLETIFQKISILPCHYSLHVLKNCYSAPKLIYLLRTAPCFKENILANIDSIIQKATSDFGNINITNSALEQAMLPSRIGGLGIRNASELAIPAYLSSVVSAESLASSINPLFRRGTHFEEGLLTWQTRTQKEGPSDATKQKSWDNELVKIKHQGILDVETDVYHQKRLQSVQSKNASDWLNALPSKNLGTYLSDEEIRPALCLRLGLSFAEEHQCKCGALTDRLGKHCFSCKRNNGKTIRHNTVNKLISHSLQSMGMPNILEPSNLFNANGVRPDGVTLLPYKCGKSLIWDFTCPHPLCTSHLTRTNITAAAETAKEVKYAPLSENYSFTPIAIDTMGVYGPQAKKFINHVGTKLSEKYNDPRRKAFLKQSIGIAIQRGNAKTMLFSIY
jgi:hypothetical protein